MKRKRIFLLVIALMVLLITIAGCAIQETAQTSEPEKPAQTNETVQQGEEPEDDFPNEKIITWVVAAPAGNPADMAARILAPKLEELLGQTIVVENKGGAGGINALGYLQNAKPDGYTWSTAGFGHICLTPHSTDCPYEHDSFQPIANMFVQPHVFVVGNDEPYDTFEDWVEYVKANPGTFKIAVNGATSIMNLTAIGIKQELGIEISTVIYDSNPEALVAVMGGHINATIMPLSNALSAIQENNVKVLAYTTQTKSEELDARNLQELGLKTEAAVFNGVLTSKDIPANRLEILKTAFQTALIDPEVIEQMENATLYYEGGNWDAEKFEQVIRDSYADFKKILEDSGLMEDLYR